VRGSAHIDRFSLAFFGPSCPAIGKGDLAQDLPLFLGKMPWCYRQRRTRSK
jgi:hypothetical protein